MALFWLIYSLLWGFDFKQKNYLLLIFYVYFIFKGKLARLKSLKLVVSHKFLHKKMDEFGCDHDEILRSNIFMRSQPWKVLIDNFDFRTRVHGMTEDHQDSDEHWVSMACTDNRITDENKLIICIN